MKEKKDEGPEDGKGKKRVKKMSDGKESLRGHTCGQQRARLRKYSEDKTSNKSIKRREVRSRGKGTRKLAKLREVPFLVTKKWWGR